MRLFAKNIDEQLICECTGHSSTAVRNYKCTSSEQMQAITKILGGQPAKCPKSATVSKAPPKTVSVNESEVQKKPAFISSPVCVSPSKVPDDIVPLMNKELGESTWEEILKVLHFYQQ